MKISPTDVRLSESLLFVCLERVWVRHAVVVCNLLTRAHRQSVLFWLRCNMSRSVVDLGLLSYIADVRARMA